MEREVGGPHGSDQATSGIGSEAAHARDGSAEVAMAAQHLHPHATSGDAAVRQELLDRIRARRASIAAFVRDLEPRAGRLANVTIVSSALVTALTAGPALGGTKFTAGIQGAAQLPNESFVWRILCFAAMIFSIVAIIATNMSKSRDVANRLNKAEACNAALEGLDAQLAFGHLPVAKAVGLYQQYVAEIPFVPEQTPPPR